MWHQFRFWRDDISDLPNKARVVIIGGGVIGCSVA
jgi:pyruvate/2-oxoglutarate dehydrogenase complex dihydrolipoamide dehydrogenase (E3) component